MRVHSARYRLLRPVDRRHSPLRPSSGGPPADTGTMSPYEDAPLSLGWSWSGQEVPTALIDYLRSHESGGGILAVSGPTGSGSETLTASLADVLPASRHLSFAPSASVIAQADKVSRQPGWVTFLAGARADSWSGFLPLRLAAAAENENAGEEMTERVLGLTVVALHVMWDMSTGSRMTLLLNSGK